MKPPGLTPGKTSAILALAISLTEVFNSLPARGQTILIATNTTIDGGTTGYDGKSLIVSNCILTVTSGVHPFNRVLLTNSSWLDLQGGSIQGAVITTASGASLVVSSGTLEGVTVNGVLDVGNTYVADLTVLGGLVLNGTLLVGNAIFPFGGITFAGSQTLSGNGTLVFGGDNFNALRLANAGTTLAIGSGITVRGGNGTIGYSADYGGPADVGVINQGKISADVAGGTIVVKAKPFTNEGLAESPSGTLNLAGTLGAGGLGNIRSGAGRLALSGVLTNTGQTVLLQGPTNVLTLQGGNIQGGTIASTNGASFIVYGSGRLDGVTVNGVLDVGNTYSGANLTVTNGAALNGTALVGNPSNGNYGAMSFAGTQTLNGNGTVVFGNAGGYYGNALYLAIGGTTLTIGAGITVRGQNGLLGSDFNNNYFTSGGPQNVSVVNQGTIRADVAAGIIIISAQPFINQGLLSSPVGSLRLAGTLTTGDLDNIQSGSGSLSLSGVLTNTAHSVLLNGASNVLTLAGGTIMGGTVVTSNGASVIVNSSGTLDGVTLNGVLDVGNAYAGANLRVTHGLALNGTALLGHPSNGNYGAMEFVGSQTLSGNGTVVFGNAAGYYGNAFYLAIGGTTLTIGGGITIRGQNGLLGSDFYNNYFTSGGPENVSMINQGTISADVAGGTITIIAQPLSNAGTLSATIGTLNLGGVYNLAGGTLNVGLGGLSSFGKITFPAPASFGGTFTVSKLNGYLPRAGDTFQVLSYPSPTNSFTCLGGLDLGGGILLQPQFGRTSLTLRAAAYTISAGQPQLFINRTLGGIALTWPAGFPASTLRSTTNLTSPAWTTVPSPCGNQAVVPISAQQQYFRLENP